MKGKSAAGRLPVLKRLLCFAVFVLAALPVCFGQKYTFSPYGISEGLIQSQVNAIAQDKDHSLWIGTYGGLSHFDGKEFTSYTRANGLPNDFIYTVFIDKDNVKWIGTESGIATVTGNKIFVYKTPPLTPRASVTRIVQDKEGTIWFLMGNQLYKISKQKIVREIIADPGREILSCLVTDEQGRLYTWIYSKGFYSLNGSKWSQLIPYNDPSVTVRVVIFENDARQFYLLSDRGLYRSNGNGITPYYDKLTQNIHSQLLTMERDADGNLWLGTTVGAYSIKNDKLIHFSTANGFVDKAIPEIFCDRDKNLWLATQGNGLYKHEGDSFVIFDKSQGLSDEFSLYGITKNDAGDVILGLDGGGLVQFDGKKFSPIPMPADKPFLRRIQCLYMDKNGALLIGTEIKGVWRYDRNGFKIIEKTDHLSIDAISSDTEGNTWIATPFGCFYADTNYKLSRVAGSFAFAFSVLPVGKDSVFIGTHNGLALAVNKKIVKDFRIDAVKNLAVICLIKHGENLILGTDDNGVYVWNMATGNIKNFNAGNGLNSNAIYSLATDDHGTIWLGTGRGANKLQFDKQQNSFKISKGKNSQEPVFESAQNGTLYSNHNIYMNTDKGLIVYSTENNSLADTRPNIIIHSVKVLNSNTENGAPASTLLKDGAELPHDRNHLNISFTGIYLKDPGGVSYRYKLESLDSSFSAPVKNGTLDYPSIPPGKYTFRVKAYNAEGLESENTAKFSFTIVAPFYQTWPFRIAAVAFLIILGTLIQAYRHNLKSRRIAIIEDIRREENIKVRQEAAEDFHDDLGNKLTRISVLSDMLFTKLDPEKTDQKKLLEQIKQNALMLYTGTKDILWAMDSQSDNLYEVINYIREFGVDLYIDTPVKFELIGLEQSLSQVKLPIKFNRNIILIFKELLNNALKHANPSQVTIDLILQKKNELKITLTDDGKGFNPETARKGQGINNIITRARRIGGEVNIKSAVDEGTAITLTFKLNIV